MVERSLKPSQRAAAPARSRGASRSVAVGAAANDNRAPPLVLVMRAIVGLATAGAVLAAGYLLLG